MEKHSFIGSLARVEATILLGTAGISLDETQWTRLVPHLIPTKKMAAHSGSLQTDISVFARRHSLALGLDHASLQLAIVRADGAATHFRSSEMAIRTFLSDSVDDSSGV